MAATGTVATIALAPAGAQMAAGVESVAIQGDPLVGATLTAVPTPADPGVPVQYRWRRCKANGNCARVHTGLTYAVVAADVGSVLTVRAVFTVGTAPQARVDSPSTAIVTDPTPMPTPTPTPTPTPVPQPTPEPSPEPSPDPGDDADDPTTFEQSGKQAEPPPAAVPADELLARPLPLMRPFPVVRVKGTLARGGARISLLRVKAPDTATVDVRCSGPRCHVRRRSFGTGRIEKLERYLPAGARITIRVSRAGAIGKYVRLLIRQGRAPRRQDACVVPGNNKPAECPEA